MLCIFCKNNPITFRMTHVLPINYYKIFHQHSVTKSDIYRLNLVNFYKLQILSENFYFGRHNYQISWTLKPNVHIMFSLIPEVREQ